MFQGGCISFLFAAVTNYRKLGGLKQHRFINLEFRGSDIPHGAHWAKIEVEAGLCFILEVLEENLFPGLIHLLEAAHIPWLWPLPPFSEPSV